MEMKNLTRILQFRVEIRKWKKDFRKNFYMKRIVTRGDPYYQKPVDYAMAIYSYYECYKRKKPHFGGLKKCEDLMQEVSKNENFKLEELFRAECSSVGIIRKLSKTWERLY